MSINLKQYLKACKEGIIENIDTEIFENTNFYRLNEVKQGITVACEFNQVDVLKFIWNEMEKAKHNDYIEDELPVSIIQQGLKTYMFNHTSETFKNNSALICRCGSLDVFKFFYEKLNATLNLHDFEVCFKSSQQNLTMMEHLLALPNALTFIEHWKYYHNFLDTSDPLNNNVIKYFIEQPQLNAHIKVLSLLEKAYSYDNKNLVEYIILDYQIPYSKKVRKTVESMISESCNVPQLFEYRNKMIVAHHLEETLLPKEITKSKIKI